MNFSSIPNLITVVRILLVVPIAGALLQQQYGVALVLFFVAGVSDGLDGFLAKQFGWTSRLGAILDPLADKALLLTCYAVLTWVALLPVWLLVMIVARDLIIVMGAVIYNAYVERFEAFPTLISKLNTLLQILLVLLVIVRQINDWFGPFWEALLVYAVSVSVVWSGLDYVITWSRRARNASSA